MSEEKKPLPGTDEPALPHTTKIPIGNLAGHSEKGIGGGFSKRERAAIDLCIPDSGTPWLDEMIRKARRERIAAALWVNAPRGDNEFDVIAQADALTKALDEEKEK